MPPGAGAAPESQVASWMNELVGDIVLYLDAFCAGFGMMEHDLFELIVPLVLLPSPSPKAFQLLRSSWRLLLARCRYGQYC